MSVVGGSEDGCDVGARLSGPMCTPVVAKLAGPRIGCAGAQTVRINVGGPGCQDRCVEARLSGPVCACCVGEAVRTGVYRPGCQDWCVVASPSSPGWADTV